jgi:hypothetical protein
MRRLVPPLAALIAASAQAQTGGPQPVRRGQFLESERSIYFARVAEKRGDVASAAQEYTTAISLIEASAPRGLDLGKLVIAGEPLPSVGRRMVYFQIKLYLDQIASARPTMRPEAVLRDLRGTYGKMQWIEPDNPTWPYLEAVALAADQDYRAAFQKCREAAQSPGGEEAVREKARSLAMHIKPAALAQERMKEADQRAYEDYVRSGAQALDFAAVSAQTSAAEARRRGDQAQADMWERRYQDLKREREQIGR